MKKVNLRNEIKMIAVDLDGTVLKDDKTISHYTIDTFEKCRQQGIIIVIATARPVRATDIYLGEIKPSAKVCHNGGITFIEDMVISNYQIPADTAHDIVRKVQRKYPQIKIGCDLNETLYTNFDLSKLWDDVEYVYTDYSKPFADNVDKLIMSIEEYPDFSQYIHDMLPSDVYADIADNSLAYIMNKNVSKHNGLSLALEQMQISPENVACFGDDTPDIGMIQFCGAGVAMGNAKDSVKAVADFICESNEDDGVAKWIEENILKDI